MRFPFKTALSLILLAAVAIGTSGCNYIVLLGYLIGGPPSIEPDFDSMTGESLTDKEVIVAVVCYAPKEVLYDYSRVDRDIAKYVSYQMTAKLVVAGLETWATDLAGILGCGEGEPREKFGAVDRLAFAVFVDLVNSDVDF